MDAFSALSLGRTSRLVLRGAEAQLRVFGVEGLLLARRGL